MYRGQLSVAVVIGTAGEPGWILVLHQTVEQLSEPGLRSVDFDCIYQRFRRRFDFVLAGHHYDAQRDDSGEQPAMYTRAGENMGTNDDSDARVAWLLSIDDQSVMSERYDIP